MVKQMSLTDPPVEYGAEDGLHARVLHLDKAQMIEVPREASGDRIAAAAGRTHGAAEVDVDQVAELADRLAIVPALEVHPLADELNGRLGAVRLQRRHVQIVDEEHKVFAQRRTVYAFTSICANPINTSLLLVFIYKNKT